jgi:L-rhamnose isomerase / sugar isomerase
MIDQSHNIEGKLEAMLQSVVNIETAYAKALLVDRSRLRQAQEEGDVLGAHRVLVDAFETDVRPLLRARREKCGRPTDPVEAFRGSGHARRLASERGTVDVKSAYESS